MNSSNSILNTLVISHKRIRKKIWCTLSIIIISFYSDSQKIISENSKYSLLDFKDDTILEPIYDSIYTLSEIKIKSIRSNFFVFRKEGKLGYVIVIDSTNSEETPVSSWSKSGQVYDSIYWDGSLSAKSQYLNTDEQYRSLVKLELNKKIGFIIFNWSYEFDRLNGYNKVTGIKSFIVIEPEYDDVIVDRYPILVLNKKKGLYISSDKILKPLFDSIQKVNWNSDQYLAWQNGNCGVVHKGKLVLPVKYNKDALDIGEKHIYFRTVGEPFVIFNILDSTFTSIKINGVELPNSDESYIQADELQLDNTTFIRVSIYPSEMDVRLDSSLWIPSRILLAKSKTGIVTHDYFSPGCYYLWHNRYILEINPISRQKRKLSISIIVPNSYKTVCKFKSWLVQTEFVDIIDWGTYSEIKAVNKKGLFTTIGYIYYVGDNFSKSKIED